MKKGTKIGLIVGVLVALVVVAYTSVRKWAKQLEYGIKGFSVQSANWQSVQFILPVWIKNPTGFDIIVSNIDFDIFFGNHFISKLNTTANYKLKANSVSEYPLIFSIPYSQLIKVLSEYGTDFQDPNWKNQVKIMVDGKFSAESGLIGVNNIPLRFDQTVKNWMG